MIVKRVAAIGTETISVERIDPNCYDDLRQELGKLDVGTNKDGVGLGYIAIILDMLRRPPAVQLAINLGIVAKIMANSTVFTVIPDGINDSEKELLDLAGKCLSPKAQLAVHGLLNLHERQLFIEYFGMMFNAHKCKHTGESHGEKGREKPREGSSNEERLQARRSGGSDGAGVQEDPGHLQAAREGS